MTGVVNPPTRIDAVTATVLIFGPVTPKAPVTVVVPTLAPMFAVRSVATRLVVAVNVPVVALAAIVIVPGTVTAALSDESVTVTALGDLPERVTVPTAEAPPTTVEGASTTVRGIGGITGRANFWVTPQALAVRLAVTLLATG